LLYSAAEHPSIRENALSCRRFGKAAHRIGVEKDGRVSEATLAKALDKHPEARFVALMGVNNEIGAYTDVASLARFARARRAGGPLHIHSDLVQAAGKVPVSLSEWDIDSASLSGHKLGAPRGIGALYLRNPARALFAGGGQEGGVRGGTENTAGAVALAACLEARLGSLKEEYRLAAARFGRLIRFLRGLPGCVLIPEDRAEDDPRFSPYILQAAFRGIPGEVMVRILDDAGFAVSTGSACSARSQTRPVLAAMRLDPKTAREGIRISQGWSTTFADIDALISAVSAAGGGGTTASSGAAVSGH
ncbi:MAG: aminotransferase class V-fold PLP-dependent enzyme, partial [Spirochaetaceae bacterium]|nr:aminotransferase class V-fold PLP-dependent enzyme [Spirochaetaceae bacterium]